MEKEENIYSCNCTFGTETNVALYDSGTKYHNKCIYIEREKKETYTIVMILSGQIRKHL
jgi:hypothetical protein